MILGVWTSSTWVDLLGARSPLTSASVFFSPLFSCGHQMNNLPIKGVIERPCCNAFVTHCVSSPCTLLKLLISSESVLNPLWKCSELCLRGRTVTRTRLQLRAYLACRCSYSRRRWMHCFAFFLPLSFCVEVSFIWSRLIGDGKAFWRGERTLFRGCRKEAAESFGVSSGAPLISVKAFIVSSGRAADEELHRRREEMEAC